VADEEKFARDGCADRLKIHYVCRLKVAFYSRQGVLKQVLSQILRKRTGILPSLKYRSSINLNAR
jgi:hypothetical protein